jgi:hypothetical protein
MNNTEEFLEIEDYLELAKDFGFAKSYLEQLGGGVMAVWIPLDSTVYEYALLNELGIGLYPHGWDGDQIEMIYHGDEELEEPTALQVRTALEEMKSALESVN